MMITPYEIETKEFSKSMRGYDKEEVDEFLDLIILDLQKLLAENENLKMQIKSLEKDLGQYKKSETSVLNTLESAKRLMNDISESAEKRAEIIIKNAQMDADSIQRDARESISKLTEEGEKLKYKVSKFRERYRQLLEEQLSQLEGSSEELFDDLEREFMPASMDTQLSASDNTNLSYTEEVKPAEEKSRQKTSDLKSHQRQTEFQDGGNQRDTVVINGDSLEKMLMENFGVQSEKKPAADDDLTKTRIVR